MEVVMRKFTSSTMMKRMMKECTLLYGYNSKRALIGYGAGKIVFCVFCEIKVIKFALDKIST